MPVRSWLRLGSNCLKKAKSSPPQQHQTYPHAAAHAPMTHGTPSRRPAPSWQAFCMEAASASSGFGQAGEHTHIFPNAVAGRRRAPGGNDDLRSDAVSNSLIRGWKSRRGGLLLLLLLLLLQAFLISGSLDRQTLANHP